MKRRCLQSNARMPCSRKALQTYLTMHNMPNLNGLRVLNTRPEQQAIPLAEAIKKAGGISINLPIITIEPTDTTWKK